MFFTQWWFFCEYPSSHYIVTIFIMTSEVVSTEDGLQTPVFISVGVGYTVTPDEPIDHGESSTTQVLSIRVNYNI